MSEKPNPFPTRNRLIVMREIEAGQLRHYHFVSPSTVNRLTDRVRTAIVREFAAADPPLADLGEANDVNTSMVRLTEAGREYLDTYGKNGATS